MKKFIVLLIAALLLISCGEQANPIVELAGAPQHTESSIIGSWSFTCDTVKDGAVTIEVAGDTAYSPDGTTKTEMFMTFKIPTAEFTVQVFTTGTWKALKESDRAISMEEIMTSHEIRLIKASDDDLGKENHHE